jgi:hypothetical protein
LRGLNLHIFYYTPCFSCEHSKKLKPQWALVLDKSSFLVSEDGDRNQLPKQDHPMTSTGTCDK